MVELKFSPCLVKHRAMKVYGNMEVEFHTFLATALPTIRYLEQSIAVVVTVLQTLVIFTAASPTEFAINYLSVRDKTCFKT
jgi:hypothetical protein